MNEAEKKVGEGGYCELCQGCRNCCGGGDGWNEPFYNYCRLDLDPVFNEDEEIWAWECDGFADIPEPPDTYDEYRARKEGWY